MKNSKWLLLVILGATIGMIRIVLIGQYHATGVQPIPEYIMVASFYIQISLISLGFALFYLKRQSLQ